MHVDNCCLKETLNDRYARKMLDGCYVLDYLKDRFFEDPTSGLWSLLICGLSLH